jgi:hypothetical protein
MFAYCGNNPISFCDIGGDYSSPTDDNDGNGIPDYLDYNWAILTAKVKAKMMGERAIVSADCISFKFSEEYIEFCEIAECLGEYGAAEIISSSACAKYNNQIGRPFILSNSCVANEYFEHVLAYQWAVGDRLLPTAIVLAWSIDSKSYDESNVYDATSSIDIRISDVKPKNYQAIAFDYKNGIRACYIGSELDPWRDER